MPAAARARAAADGSRATARFGARGIAFGAECSIDGAGGEAMSAVRGNIGDGSARHARAVAQTLGWADEAAARGDHAGALEWLRTLEVIGHELSKLLVVLC